LWPFKSQIPGSNPGRSTFSLSATNGLRCDLPLHQATPKVAIQWKYFNSYLEKEFDTGRTPEIYMILMLTISDGRKRHTMKALPELMKIIQRQQYEIDKLKVKK
jgi:hypothetical protein